MSDSLPKLNAKYFKKYLRVFVPSNDESADAWAGAETASTKVGDIFMLFNPAPENLHESPEFELELSGIAMVFREDAFFPMNYLLDEDTYEMSFMEGVLSSKASEAKEAGMAFYCARASVLNPLSKEETTALASMERKYGGSGMRKKEGLAEPFYFFLTTLGVEISPALENSPLPIRDIALSMLSRAELGSKSDAPITSSKFAPQAGSGIPLSDADKAAVFEEAKAEGAPAAAEDVSAVETAAPTETKDEKPAEAAAPESPTPVVASEPTKAEAAKPDTLLPPVEDSAAVWDMLKAKPNKPASEKMESLLERLDLVPSKPDASAAAKAKEEIVEKKEEPAPTPAKEEIAEKKEEPAPTSAKEEIVEKKEEAAPTPAKEEIAEKKEEPAPTPAKEEIAEKKEEAAPTPAKEEIPEKKEEPAPTPAKEEIAEKKEEPAPTPAKEEIVEKKEEPAPTPAKEEIVEKKEEPAPTPAKEEIAEKKEEPAPTPAKEEIAEKKEEPAPAKESSAEKKAEPADDKDDSAEPGEAPARKTVSIAATMEKLEEQKQKAHSRIEAFRTTHETECAEGLALLRQSGAKFEQEFTDKLKELKKSLISKLRVMSIESDQKLGGIVDESKSKIEERIAPSLAELKAVADEKLIEAAFAKLQTASDEFATSFADSLGNLLDKDLSSLLGEAVKEELARLNTWRSTELESFSEYFEQTLIQLKQNKNKGISSLDTCVNSMTEELRRLKDFDLQRLALLKTEVNETFEQVRQHSHMRLTQHCDKALAEQILPLLSQRKSALALMAHDMRKRFAELLDAHSNESLAEFDVVLGQGKENMAAIETSMAELKAQFETDGKKSLEDAAASLGSHLDKRVIEIKEAIEAAKEDSKTGAKGAKDKLKQRAEQTRKDCLAKLNELYDSLSESAKKQHEETMAAFESKTGASSTALAKDISEEIESLKARREVAQMKIEKMLETLTEKAEAIPAEFIQ